MELDIRHTRRFVNISRFINDLPSINDGREFERSCKDTHVSKLELKEGFSLVTLRDSFLI